MIKISIGQDIFESFTNDKNNSKQDIVQLSKIALKSIRRNPNKVASDMETNLYDFCNKNNLCHYCGGQLEYNYKLHSMICTECGAYNNKIYE